jgi:SAM-dependent methyltransferase
MTGRPPGDEYAFSDTLVSPPDGHHRVLSHLAAMLDPFTVRRLAQAGVASGARCLEVGAGAGTIARWLADRVGPDGQVVATDLDPSHIPAHPAIVPVTHDIATDDLPEGRYHLIHARLVLACLPERRRVLARLAAALAPGGALVVEEFDPCWDQCVLDTPDPEAHRLFSSYHTALMAVLRAAGTDPGWGRQVHHAMRGCGLEEVCTEWWAQSWHGAQTGCLLPYATAAQVRDQLVANGMSPDDLDRFRALLLDPRLVIHGNMAVSTVGCRP